MWAGSSGTPACAGAPTPSDTGSLAGTGASYAASYSYDSLNRLTSAPLGGYSYGDPAHADAVTSISGGSTAWSASYDAAGNLTCREPGATICAGASLSYDNEGRLTGWQNTPSSPTQSIAYLYDGAGNRVQQVATVSGTTTTTSYLGSLEEVSTIGGSTTTTASYGSLAESVNGALYYTLSDGLGSVSEAVSASGATSGQVVATQLYAPYGQVRYTSGTLPTDKGYTGQVADALTGLDYDNARYYDPMAGQFTSADTTLAGGLNEYAYVDDNPESRTDPTGHYLQPTSGGGTPRLDPVPNRDGYTKEFARDYWTDQSQGTGTYSDWLWQVSVRRSLERDSRSANQKAEDALIAQDAPTLASWFGLTMWRVPETKGAGGPSPDLMVGINQGVVISGAGPLMVADPSQTMYSTGVELYQPQSNTPWLDLPGGRPAGIIGEVYLKGAQASIIAVDISLKDPDGKLDRATLNGYAADMVYWAPTSNPKGAGPSRVMRVIFIRNGEVVDDYNPLNFGPPNHDTRPIQYLQN